MTTTANVDDLPAQPPPWIPGDDSFGARLALVRQRMGWGNVAEAAQACGIPVPTWRNWERDGRQPRNIVEIAGIIAERTGCDYIWLLSGRGGRHLTTIGATGGATSNDRSSHRHPRAPRLSGSATLERLARHPRPEGRPQSGPAGPGPAVPPTQRRPALIGAAS